MKYQFTEIAEGYYKNKIIGLKEPDANGVHWSRCILKFTYDTICQTPKARIYQKQKDDIKAGISRALRTSF